MSHYNVSSKCGSFLIAFLLLCGCAAMGLVKFDKAANTHIKKIALLRVVEPTQIHIIGGYSGAQEVTGAGAGLVGTGTGMEIGQKVGGGGSFWTTHPAVLSTAGKVGGAAGSIAGGLLTYFTIQKPTMKKRSQIFLKAKDENFVFFGPPMAKAIQQELTQKGYDVIYLEDMMMGRSPPNGVVQVKHIKDVQTDADAILFVHIAASYSAPDKLFRRKRLFKPGVSVHVRLYDSRSKKVIYARHIAVGEGSRASTPTVTIIRPDEKYKYDSFGELMNNFDEAVQGIIDCQTKIAARIAEHLK